MADRTGMTWKMEGLDQLQKQLVALGPKVSHKVIRKGLVEGAKVVEESIIGFAPRLSGFLAAHINTKLRLGKDNTSGTAFIGPAGRTYYPNKGDRNLGVSTGQRPKAGGAVPVASVARFNEFGTSKMAAQPFLQPGFAVSVHAALDRIIVAIREALGSL